MICFLVGLNAFKLHTLVFQIHSFCYLHLQGSVALQLTASYLNVI